jgi:hypothetical protein
MTSLTSADESAYMSRGSALSAIVLERLGGRQASGRRKPTKWSIERLAWRDVGGLEQPVDAVPTYGREHRDGLAMMGDLNRLAVAHATDRCRQLVAQLPYSHLIGHL